MCTMRTLGLFCWQCSIKKSLWEFSKPRAAWTKLRAAWTMFCHSAKNDHVGSFLKRMWYQNPKKVFGVLESSKVSKNRPKEHCASLLLPRVTNPS